MTTCTENCCPHEGEHVAGSNPCGCVVNERVQVIVRMDKALVKRIDHYAVDRNLYRGEAMAELIERAL